MIEIINIATHRQTELLDITEEVKEAVAKSKVTEGTVTLFVPHTTAGLTINENADPAVKLDILRELNKVIPFDDAYSHMEGNSAAHIKSSLFGPSLAVIVSNGKPVLGTWQGIYFCEFDGPRNRKFYIKIQSD